MLCTFVCILIAYHCFFELLGQFVYIAKSGGGCYQNSIVQIDVAINVYLLYGSFSCT